MFHIDIPEDIEKYVWDNLKLTLTQVSKCPLYNFYPISQLGTEILQKYPKPSFTHKSIYQIWLWLSSCSWKRDEDEIRSARILLEEFWKPSADHLYTVELIPVEQGEGITVIAFTLPENLCQ